MRSDQAWVQIQSFPERGRAEVLAVYFEAQGVPTKIEARVLESAVETHHGVYVARALVHRARWLMAQHPLTEDELGFLATGKLPGQE